MYLLVKIPAFANKSFYEFTKSESKEFFKWFLSIRNERLSVMQTFVQLDYPSWHLDYSNSSLAPLYEWLVRNSSYRPTTREEQFNIEKQVAQTPQLSEIIPIPKVQFTEETVSMTFDAGVYFGESLIKNNGELRWIQKISSTNFIDYAQPLIARNNTKVPINPRRIMEGYVRRALNNEIEETPLHLLFEMILNKFS
jgi:hypothetical protein